jgi:phage terminase large subunit-like protein
MYPLLLWDLIKTTSSESYLFAKDDTQALHFLNDIKKIIIEDKDLNNYVKYNVSNITLKKSKISCFSSETVGIDGYKPSLAIIDEYWCYKNERCVTAMRYGGRARLNSLVLIITTAGLDISLPAYSEYEKTKKILNGILTDDTYFGVIYEADEDDDWKSSNSYIKANPSIDTIIDRKILEQDLQDCLLTPSHQADYKAKTLNWWTSSTSNWIPIQKWDTKIRNKQVDVTEFNRECCYAGLDLSSINDFTSYTKCFQKNGLFYLFHKFYVPTEQVLEKYRVENINITD